MNVHDVHKEIVVGQECVVQGYGLGQVLSYSKDTIKVKPYMTDYSMRFSPTNVKLVKLTFTETG
jgi:hypothetical protein